MNPDLSTAWAVDPTGNELRMVSCPVVRLTESVVSLSDEALSLGGWGYVRRHARENITFTPYDAAVRWAEAQRLLFVEAERAYTLVAERLVAAERLCGLYPMEPTP